MSKKSMITNRTILQTGAILSIVLLLSVQYSFGSKKKKILADYLQASTITSARIATDKDTINVKDLNAFLSEIGAAEKMGPLKYAGRMEILLTRKNGESDHIHTNGKVFTYQSVEFVATSDVVSKYLK